MSTFTAQFNHISSAKHGIIISAILIGGAFSGLFAGNIADIHGRKETIVVGALIFGIGAALEASAFGLGQFIGGRVVMGLGEGLFLGTLMVYVCEVAPARRRG
jgi:MFS family permease